jgi:3-dehydroquinate synthase
LEAVNRISINVPPRPYEALIENGLLGQAGSCLREMFPESRGCFVVTVPPVRRKWGKKLMSSLFAAGWRAKIIEMRDGERHKRLATIEQLAEKLAALGAERGAVIVAFGGGVAGDVAGFLASVYMRGVDVVQIPTTVLAQVDASIGGKTGVNLRAGKNLVGAFHQPRMVLIDPDVLATLPEREFRAGLYEALKCGVIGNAELFGRFEERRDAILKRDAVEIQWLIRESVKLKAAVVAEDEREGGLRRVLNFGHTIGHALEAETGYRHFLHGEAVAWGMIAAGNIAAAVGMSEAETSRRISDAVLSLGRLPRVGVQSRNILRLLKADKKTKNGIAHFILPRAIGKVEVVSDVPEREIIDAVNGIRRMSNV